VPTIHSMRRSFLTKSASRFHHSYFKATIASIFVGRYAGIELAASGTLTSKAANAIIVIGS